MNNINVGATASSGANAGVSVVNTSSGTGVDFDFTMPPGRTVPTGPADGGASFTEVSVTAPRMCLNGRNLREAVGEPDFQGDY